ncbi:MAG: divalent cation tolerance protein CutA [Alphaproteobacteria bacterium]|nr:divalent cation tolerance protein CutA [Alphaproteobacteria bacterium]
MTAADIRLLYVTAPDAPTATALAEALVAARLAACVNILGEMTSVFRWDGEIQKEREIAMIVKTRAAMAGAARDLILERHPYDEPAILALPVDGAGSSAAFCDWIGAETQKT